MVRSDMAQRAFDTKVAVLDTLIQEVQELADLYVRLLDVPEDASTTDLVASMGDMLQAFAKTYIAYRHTVTTISATVTARGGLEIRADWDF